MIQNPIILSMTGKGVNDRELVLSSSSGLHFYLLTLLVPPLMQPTDLGMQRAKHVIKSIMYYLLAAFKDDLASLARHFLIIFLLL